MGDLIHTLPALTDALTQIPTVQFHWVAEKSFEAIPSWHPAVHRVITMEWRRWRKHLLSRATWQALLALKKQLSDTHYDVIIDAQGLLKSAFLAGLSRGPRWGYDWRSAREPLARLWYQHALSVRKDLHAITRARQLVCHALNYAPSAFTSEPDYGMRTARFPAMPDGFVWPTDPKNCLLFIHGTSKENKCWPVSHWIRMIQKAEQHGYHVLLPWGNASEKARAETLAQTSPHAHRLPALHLGQFARLYTQIKATIGLDTGLAHLAAACSQPMVSLYGPTKTELIGAWGKHQIHLQATTMDQITPESVWAALAALLAERLS